MTRTLAELHHATRVVMRRHRVIRWSALAVPQNPPPVPEWLRRGIAKDLTGLAA
jgi:hypothetical protein